MDYKNRDGSSCMRHKDYMYLDGDKTKMCPNCGHNINPLFVSCPFCDFDFRDLDSHELCSNCGRIIDDCDEICHACGVSLKPHESSPKVVDLCDEGFRHIRNFDIKKAKICFNKASKIDSMDANPIVGNGYCLYYLGYYVLALKKFDEARKLDPDCVDDEFYRKVQKKADSVKG